MTDTQREKNQRLKAVRKAYGMSQAQMANLLQVHRGNLSKIENNEEGRNVPKDAIFILKEKLNVNPQWFETGEGEMFLPKSPGAEDYDGIRSIVRDEALIVNEPPAPYETIKDKLIRSYEKNMESLDKNIQLLEEVSRLKDQIIEAERELRKLLSEVKK